RTRFPWKGQVADLDPRVETRESALQREVEASRSSNLLCSDGGRTGAGAQLRAGKAQRKLRHARRNLRIGFAQDDRGLDQPVITIADAGTAHALCAQTFDEAGGSVFASKHTERDGVAPWSFRVDQNIVAHAEHHQLAHFALGVGALAGRRNEHPPTRHNWDSRFAPAPWRERSDQFASDRVELGVGERTPLQTGRGALRAGRRWRDHADLLGLDLMRKWRVRRRTGGLEDRVGKERKIQHDQNGEERFHSAVAMATNPSSTSVGTMIGATASKGAMSGAAPPASTTRGGVPSCICSARIMRSTAPQTA